MTSAEPLGRSDFLADWLARGCAGKMAYLARNSDVRDDPRRLLEGARSVICLAAGYLDRGPDDLAPCPPGHGYVARYARGRDYHDVLRARGRRLVELLRGQVDGPFDARVCVDTAPLLERELAARAGLGWVGKNTLLLDPRSGSYCFLAEVLTTLAIAPDQPMGDHCGACRRCLDACPTHAFVSPGVMDASRCISYLTIELRDAELPADLAGATGSHLFGCDICQAVCPFNQRFAGPADDMELVPPDAAGRAHVDAEAVLRWTGEDYRRELTGRAAGRAKLDMWHRNARLVRECAPKE